MAMDGATASLPDAPDELTRLRQEVEFLRASIHESSSELESLRSSCRQSSQELELVRAQRQQLTEQLQDAQRNNEHLQQKLQYLLHRLYGRSSEKIDPRQLVLFKELLERLAPERPAPDASDESAAADKPKRKGHGRQRLPATLRRELRVHDLPESEKPCPCCGKVRDVISRETSEQLEYEPAQVWVVEHVRLTYGCRHCEQQATESGPQIVTAPKPLSPIEKGLAGSGLLAHIIVSKYGDHLPLYRMERILERHGVELTRQTMCGWMARCADLLQPLYRRMVQQVLGSKVIHTDDTPVDVLDRTIKRDTRTGRFWVYVGDPEHACTVFDYTPSRQRDGPMEFLKGWGKDRPVFLQADAFSGYDGIYLGQSGGSVKEAACMAHARRKFHDARMSDATASTQALAYVRLLYDVEDEARKRFEEQVAARSQGDETVAATWRHDAEARRLFSSIRYELRQARSVPRLTQFKEWLESQRAESGGSILPKSPMGQAITYALNQWDALCVYTSDGDLAIDNNAAENALRRVALGRKNWLFCGSDNGGTTAAVLFTLIATCQRHKVEPFAYLRDLLTRIAETPVSQIDQFLPERWKAARIASRTA
jgi:transposase